MPCWKVCSDRDDTVPLSLYSDLVNIFFLSTTKNKIPIQKQIYTKEEKWQMFKTLTYLTFIYILKLMKHKNYLQWIMKRTKSQCIFPIHIASALNNAIEYFLSNLFTL